MPTSSDSRDYGRFDELAEEFAERYRRGERPSLEEYVDRLPEMADEIREMFPALLEVEQVEEDAGEPPPSRAVPRLRQLGDYRIIREIGHGGMGIVYEAEQVSLGRHVALKVLPNHALKDSKQKRRFEREARAAAKLHHTNIVPVFGVGEHDGLPYYVMQYIQGQGLDAILDELNHIQPGGSTALTAGEIRLTRRGTTAAQMARSLMTGAFPHGDDVDEERTTAATMAGDEALAEEETGRPDDDSLTLATSPAGSDTPRSGHLSDSLDLSASSPSLPGTSSAATGRRSAARKQSYWQSVANIGRQVADALDFAHNQGILHRDVKPSNLLLDTRGTVWVTDFGLAKVAGPGADNLTHTGDILGTLRYMPPEAFEGKSDAKSDVYSLGLTLYELLAMRPAFAEKERNKLIKQVTSGEPAPLYKVRREIPRDLVTIVQKSIEREPARRYATAEELGSDLQRFIDDEPILARRQTELERYVRWARHNPGIAVLGAVLTAVLVMATIASLIVAGQMARSVADERLARLQAVDAHKREAEERTKAELARKNAEASKQRAEEALEKAKSSFAEARKAEKEAIEQRKRADDVADVAQQNLYHAQMLLAPQVWRGGHKSLFRLEELLTSWLPQGDSRDRRGWEWFYLNSLPYQNLRTLTESEGDNRPSTVAWHVASKRLAEGTVDGLIRIWDVDREQTTLMLRAPAPVVHYWGSRWLAWSPDGHKLAAGGANGAVHVWETHSGRELIVLRGHNDRIVSVAFSSDGTRVAAWGYAGTIKIWDAGTGRLTATVVHPGSVGAGAWSPDDKLLATGHGDGTVTISGKEAGDRIAKLGGSFAPITSLAWSPDSARLASTSSYDYTARIWDVASEKMVVGPLFHSHEIMAAAWEPDGQRLATGSIDETVKIWDAITGRETVALRGNFRHVTSIAWGADGRLASGAMDGSMRVWSSIHDQESRVLPGHKGRAHSVAWSPNGKRLASGGDDGKVRIWDPAAGREVMTLKAHDQGRVNGQFGLIRSLAWSPDGKLLASAGLDARAKVWDVAGGREVFALPADHGWVWSVAWSPDGTHLAAGSADGTIRVVEGLNHTPKVHVFTASQGGVRTVAWSPRGDRLASGDMGGVVKLWDPIRGAELTRIDGHQGYVLALAWSRDGKRLASGSTDLLAIAWDAETGRKLAAMRNHHGWVEGVAWSPDGTRLASAGTDDSVRVWDPQTGHEAFVLRGNSGMFHDVSWNPDGAQIAAASSDGQIWIWDATRGFERDTTPRALPYIDRAVASGTARGEDLLSYAKSYSQAGKTREALVALNGDPYGLCKLARLLDEQGKAQQAGEARTRARALLERQLAAEPDNEAPASALADLLLLDLPPSDTTAWTTLKLIGMKSEGGATLALQGDGSILASGKNPDREVYTLVARPGLEHISAIRLEALPDPSLPGNGPGRCPGCANFHLNEMRVFSGSEPSTLTDIFVADNEAHDFREVIDGKIDEMPGWGTYRTRGEKHTAIVAAHLERAPNDDLKIELYFSRKPASQHNLGHFRLSVSSASPNLDREQKRSAAMKLADPWAKLAAAYHLVENRQALDALLERHGAAAAGIGDLYAAAHDWQRAIALYRQAITHQPADADLPAKLAAVYQSAGRTRESVPLLAMASAANPQDTILSLKVGAFQAWFGQDKEFADTCARGLEFANGTSDPTTADRTAKMCFLRPAQNKNRLESALALARKAVQLGKNDSLLPYFQMAHGMALYRNGHFAEADAALIAAANGAKNNPHVAGTSAFYRAMSLFQQGKKDDARKLATEAAARMKPLPRDEQNPLAGDAVPDDLILWLAYKEADALIKFAAAPLTKAAGDKK